MNARTEKHALLSHEKEAGGGMVPGWMKPFSSASEMSSSMALAWGSERGYICVREGRGTWQNVNSTYTGAMWRKLGGLKLGECFMEIRIIGGQGQSVLITGHCCGAYWREKGLYKKVDTEIRVGGKKSQDCIILTRAKWGPTVFWENEWLWIGSSQSVEGPLADKWVEWCVESCPCSRAAL